MFLLGNVCSFVLFYSGGEYIIYSTDLTFKWRDETMELLKGLNKEQKEAALHVDGPLLILAGAGSGKTRVLTHRIAYLIKEKDVHPASILAITFTNKAAKEMKERVERLLGDMARDMWISTFHSTCVKILRRDIDKLGYDRSFVIFDTADQQTVIKSCLKELNLNDKNYPPRSVLEAIGKAKDELMDSTTFSKAYANDFRMSKIASIYELYQKKLKQNNALDFDDIIMLTIRLFNEVPPVLEFYQRKFKYIMVDEYQDTNTAQYVLISMLAHMHKNLCVVGDDDQCVIEGTRISTPEGELRVEELEEGDSLLCAAGRGKILPGVLEKKLKKEYEGIVVKIRTRSGKEIKTTPNHIGFARLNSQPGVHYVYLMYKKGKGYRIGQTQGVRSRKGEIVNGLFVRLNQEHGDKLWILKVCFDKEAAAYFEQLYSFKYGIPTTVFHNVGRGISLTQEYINRIFAEVDTEAAAQRLMKELGIFEEYPHHVCNAVIRGGTARQIINITAFGGKETGSDAGWCSHRICLNTSGEELKTRVVSCSLPVRNGSRNTWRVETERKDYDEADSYARKIAGIDENLEILKRARLTADSSYMYMPAAHMKPSMSIPVLDNGQIVEDVIEQVEFEEYRGYVYDLSVPHFRQYIANGIAVHNSIYGWRGANIRNILDFEKEFKNCKTVKLEQNYRSTGTILDAANNVIRNNTGRKSKKLWTENSEGGAIQNFIGNNEHEEAYFVANEIQKLKNAENREYKDFAILYRMNAQSRVVEEMLVKEGIPYKILGGLRFYDRKEIKDIIAYLRLIQNPSDDVSLKRIINVPKRGIGDATVDTAEGLAAKRGCSIFSIIGSAVEIPELQRASTRLDNFVTLIAKLRVFKDSMKVSKLIEEVINHTGILKELQDENTVEAETRIENIQEFISVALEFEEKSEDQSLEALLAHVSLVSDVDNMEGEKDNVILMTLHSAKGLEFPVVFMVGMEEGIFPSYRSFSEESELEEERRLCYVGITRAREKLYMTNAFCRTLFGKTECYSSSRFLREIPAELLENPTKKEKKAFGGQTEKSMGVQQAKPAAFARTFGSFGAMGIARPASSESFRVGDRVEHKKFGIGVISSVEKEKEDFKLEIQFKDAGMKRLMAGFANLKKVE